MVLWLGHWQLPCSAFVGVQFEGYVRELRSAAGLVLGGAGTGARVSVSCDAGEEHLDSRRCVSERLLLFVCGAVYGSVRGCCDRMKEFSPNTSHACARALNKINMIVDALSGEERVGCESAVMCIVV